MVCHVCELWRRHVCAGEPPTARCCDRERKIFCERSSMAIRRNPTRSPSPPPSTRVHYPQDDTPLCCCEYRDRRGDRVHFLQCCCACEEIDEAASLLFSGQAVGHDHIDQIVREIDDRMRVPMPGGAWHIGLPAAIPFFLLPPLLLMASISARALVAVAIGMLPLLFWWHRRVLRLRRRSPLLLSWMLASLATEGLLYTMALRTGWLQLSPLAVLAFALPLAVTVGAFGLIKASEVTSVNGVVDEAGALSRAHRCAVCSYRVPRYDHYCAWVDEAIGASNHRAFLLFVVSMLLTCLVGGTQLAAAALQAGYGWDAFRSNRSSLLFSCGCYGLAVALAVLALLLHQLTILLTGRTTFEARKGIDHKASNEPLSCFLKQTTPLSTLLHDAVIRVVTAPSSSAREHSHSVAIGAPVAGKRAQEHADEPAGAVESTVDRAHGCTQGRAGAGTG